MEKYPPDYESYSNGRTKKGESMLKMFMPLIVLVALCLCAMTVIALTSPNF